MAIDASITLRRLIYELSEWTTDHSMLNQFAYGKWLSHYSKEEKSYPILAVNCTGWNLEQWYVTYNLEVVVLFWVTDDRFNQERAESDATQIFTDLENTIRYSDRWQSFARLDQNWTSQKVEEYGGDKAFGFLAQFPIKIKKKSGICDLQTLMPSYDFDTTI